MHWDGALISSEFRVMPAVRVQLPPALVHFLQPNCRWWDAESLHVLIALLNAPMKQLLRVAPIPILDQRTHALGVARSRRAYMQITADQFHGVAVTQLELEPVLPAEEDVGFSAHISPFGKRWGGWRKCCNCLAIHAARRSTRALI